MAHWSHPYRVALLALALLTLAIPLAGCRAPGSGGITVAGSTSVQPFAELLSEEYARVRPDERINVQGGGSSAGIEAVLSGAAQIGMSSRELKGDETKLTRVEIARDAIAVVVHPSNPVKDLSLEQVQGIFSGKLTRWSQLGGADRPIVVVTREEGSGTRSAFQELVLGKAEVDPGSLVQDSNGAVRQLVSDDPNSIGYISLGLVNHSVKAVSLGGSQPTAQHVADGSYTLVRPFLFVLAAPPNGGPAGGFIDYALSSAGQKLLAQEGLLPPTPSK
jgi:phosphate transport system substrate-binding protein